MCNNEMMTVDGEIELLKRVIKSLRAKRYAIYSLEKGMRNSRLKFGIETVIKVEDDSIVNISKTIELLESLLKRAKSGKINK